MQTKSTEGNNSTEDCVYHFQDCNCNTQIPVVGLCLRSHWEKQNEEKHDFDH